VGVPEDCTANAAVGGRRMPLNSRITSVANLCNAVFNDRNTTSLLGGKKKMENAKRVRKRHEIPNGGPSGCRDFYEAPLDGENRSEKKTILRKVAQ